MKSSKCDWPLDVCESLDQSIGAPISMDIASTISEYLFLYIFNNFSRRFILSSFELSLHVTSACLAACTAILVSFFEPSEIVAKASSVDGLITSKSLGSLGGTHFPFI